MGTFGTYKQELVTIIIQPTALTLFWITPTPGVNFYKKHFTIRAFKHIPLNQDVFHDGLFFNLTTIKKQCYDFINVYKLKNAYCSIAVSGNHMQENMLPTFSSDPTVHELRSHFDAHEFFGYNYLYPLEQGFMFYTCSISYAHILHYHLLFSAFSLYCLTITTCTNALLQWYRYAQGSNFKYSTLALDFPNLNAAHTIIPLETLKQMISCPPSLLLEHNTHTVMSALGLLISSEMYPHVNKGIHEKPQFYSKQGSLAS